MRKYLLIATFLTSFYSSAFTQTLTGEQKQELLRREIDSLKKVLPEMSGTKKVDWLNRQAYNYFSRWMHWKLEADSAYPYAMEANAEAKKIGYKQGLAYSYLRLGTCQFLWYGSEYKEFHNTAVLDTGEKYLKQAISIAEEINDNAILGGAYRVYGWIVESRKDFVQYLNHFKKSAFYYEKSIGQANQGTYRDLDESDCTKCQGNEFALANVYHELGGAYFNVKDFDGHEDALKKEILINRKINSLTGEIWPTWTLSGVLIIQGNFETAFEYCQRNIKLVEELSKNNQGQKKGWDQGQAFSLMAELYKNAGDYETALTYIRKGYAYFPTDTFSMDLWAAQMGDVHRLMGNYDSAMHYLSPFADRPQEWVITSLTNSGTTNLIILYNSLKEYDKALTLLKAFKNNRQPAAAGFVLMLAAHVYFGKKDYSTALRFAREGLALMKPMKIRTRIVENYKLLSEIFHELGTNDSAYFYLKQYTILRDSLLNSQFYFRLNSYKKQAEEERKTSQINLLNKDNQLKEQKLKQQATLRNSLIIGFLLLLLLGIFIVRNLLLKRKNDKLRMQNDFELERLKNGKKQAELHQRAVELEMQALRAQMNPHFIFNCLSSINRFIYKNDNKVASDYLTRFSRLIRMVLMHSQKKLISLEDELEMIRLYLDLERLRFKDAFDYSITTTNIVDAGNIFIPPLLLQPFCENAVWHGLMHKESKGHLDVTISEVINENEKVLHCVIEDDGVGRAKAAEMKSKSAGKEKSLGLKITTERIALLNRENNFNTFYRIEDILNNENEIAGTRVQLKIKFKETTEEYA